MRKLLAMASLLLILAVSASAANFSMNSSNVSINPPAGTHNLFSFFTGYPSNNAGPGSRNTLAPGFEYAFDGDQLHFDANVQSTSQYSVQNMVVQVLFNCTTGSTAPVTLLPIGTPAFVGGYYQLHFTGNWNTPAAVALSANCRLSVLMTPPSGAPVTDLLNDPLYRNVNDVLANPLLGLSGTAFSFNPTIYNAYNPASPMYVDYSITSAITDTEGDGVIGDLTVEMPRFRGRYINGTLIPTNASLAEVFPVNGGGAYPYVRYHRDSDPSGVYYALTDRANMLSGFGPIKTNATVLCTTPGGVCPGTTGPIRVFWELFYSNMFTAAGGYVSDPTAFNGGNLLFTYQLV